MSEQDNISDKELREKAPLLFGLKKPEFEAPSGYFESLADKVLEQVNEETPVIEFKSNNRIYWGIAAGIAGLLGLFTVLVPMSNGIESSRILSSVEVDYEEDLDYLLAIEDDILLDIYFEGEEETVSDDNTIQFLLDEGIDYEELLNEDL